MSVTTFVNKGVVEECAQLARPACPSTSRTGGHPGSPTLPLLSVAWYSSPPLGCLASWNEEYYIQRSPMTQGREKEQGQNKLVHVDRVAVGLEMRIVNKLQCYTVS